MNLRPSITMLLSLLAMNAGAQNFLTNGGAEAGTAATGWTTVTGGTACATGFSGGWRVQGSQNGFPAARSGSYYFTAGCSSTATEIYQDVNVAANAVSIDAGTYQMTFSGWTRSFAQSPADGAEIVAEYRNAGGTVLASFTTGVTTNTAGWVRYVHTRFLPANTRTVRVRLLGTTNTGPFQDAYFDDIALVTGAAPLPLGVSGFRSLQRPGSVLLHWVDDRPSAAVPYTVEWSTDGAGWEELATIPVAGSSYSFEHLAPAAGSNYYRIRVTDAAGKRLYSETLQESVRLRGALFSAANPAAGRLEIRMRDAAMETEISLLSGDGRAVRRTGGQGQYFQLDISDLPDGIYLLQVTRGGELSQQRIRVRN